VSELLEAYQQRAQGHHRRAQQTLPQASLSQQQGCPDYGRERREPEDRRYVADESLLEQDAEAARDAPRLVQCEGGDQPGERRVEGE
jgi:hypothetical protein